ncbi:hypothetical protein ACSYAD_15395 [Acaryochloris marina NIES-2412]|uniref:hypothetical protein n=1 Tax=Acaryochloris marina TaxID=155978 RepID=UPI004057EFD5
MNKYWFNISKSSSQRGKRYKRLPIYLLSILAFVKVGVVTSLCAQAQSTFKGVKQNSNNAVAVSLPQSPLKDGVHLFGQAREPGKFQTEYLIFKTKRNRVIGAFFMPSSSFDCFAGNLQGGQLTLSILESYEQQTYEHSVNLNQYYAIQQINNNDMRILDVCAVHSGHTAQEP